jgi:hypothetical protein
MFLLNLKSIVNKRKLILDNFNNFQEELDIKVFQILSIINVLVFN